MDENYLLRVLILDDEVPSLQLIQILLQQQPCIKIIAAVQRVSEAIAIMNSQTIDLLVLDIELKGESGFDLIDKTKEISFEFVCLAATKDHAFKAFEYGSAGYLLKPVNEKELRNCFSRLRKSKPYIQPVPPLISGSRP
ncbi:MAG: response regulator [Chitinophagaceae bacterium]|nr:response regulator [Chitinophagaceae bacterium]